MENPGTDQAKSFEPVGGGTGLVGCDIGDVAESEHDLEYTLDDSKPPSPDSGQIAPKRFAQFDLLLIKLNLSLVRRKGHDVVGLLRFLSQPDDLLAFLKGPFHVRQRSRKQAQCIARVRIADPMNDQDQFIHFRIGTTQIRATQTGTRPKENPTSPDGPRTLTESPVVRMPDINRQKQG
jgi:hypothetical protein